MGMTLREALGIVTALLITAAIPAAGQAQPSVHDARDSTLWELNGVVSPPVAIDASRVRRECLQLPTDPPDDRLERPHGDTLISAHCEVIGYDRIAGSPSTCSVAHYRWTSLFTAEDRSRGEAARDTVVEEEVVLFEAADGQPRAVWHARFETGDYAVWRSITPEVARVDDGTTLLSVMSCVNGTGGCSQEFLHRHNDGRWFPVRQAWLNQLPPGFNGRIRHGVRIDPNTLRGDAGFYGDDDPNCCPSQELIVRLALHNDALVLIGQPLVRQAPK
jgi:hypothetical protein